MVKLNLMLHHFCRVCEDEFRQVYKSRKVVSQILRIFLFCLYCLKSKVTPDLVTLIFTLLLPFIPVSKLQYLKLKVEK